MRTGGFGHPFFIGNAPDPVAGFTRPTMRTDACGANRWRVSSADHRGDTEARRAGANPPLAGSAVEKSGRRKAFLEKQQYPVNYPFSFRAIPLECSVRH